MSPEELAFIGDVIARLAAAAESGNQDAARQLNELAELARALRNTKHDLLALNDVEGRTN
jgi:hypothetical protein